METSPHGALYADTHVHVYPSFDVDALFAAARRNLTAAAAGDPAPRLALFLAERDDCDWFDSRASSGTVDPREGVTIFPGRQLVTAEGVEVLALLADRRTCPSGRPLRDTIDAVTGAGAVPVLPWSPGKWLGRRGEAVRREFGSRPGLAAGDVRMRTRAFSPRGLAVAAGRPVKVFAGSDPLPFPGEERLVGTYGSRFPGPHPEELTPDYVRGLLLTASPEPTGARGGMAEGLVRQARLLASR